MNLFLVLVIIAIISFYFARRAFRKVPAETKSFENAVLQIRVPKANEKGALSAEQMFSSLHGLLKADERLQEHVSFEIFGSTDGISFYAVAPRHLKDFVESQIYAQYPNAEIREVDDYLPEAFGDGFVKSANIILAREYFFPIRTFRDFEVDPLAAITASLSKVNQKEKVLIQILARPVPDVWQQAGHDYVAMIRAGVAPVTIGVKDLKEVLVKELKLLPTHLLKGIFRPGEPHPLADKTAPPGSRLSPGAELGIKAIDLKLSKLGFEANIRVLTVAETEADAASRLRSALASFKQFSTADLNSFAAQEDPISSAALLEYCRERYFDNRRAYILTNEELGTVFHLPSISVETPAIDWTPSKRGEPPLNLPIENCTYIAKTTFRESLVRFGLRREDRRRHLYVIGKTGTGKTTLFENMVIQDMRNDEGLAVIDPHGDFIERMLNFVPDKRAEDVVLVDPGDYEYPVSLNMLEIADQRQKNLMASGLVDAFKKHFGDISWGPRLEYLLNNAILTLLEVPNTTLLGITRLLSDDNYQKYIVYKIKDPVIRDFWEREYKEMKGNQKLITEAIAPIQNKVGRFLASSTIRNILGQAKSTIHFDEIMNQGKILFINLSKGKIGEDNSNLLGSLIISRLQFTAMQRVAMPENERRDFYVYVDEFQNFASGSFASILSEARKYRLSLNLAHQYIEQLPKPMVGAIFGNVGTLISFSAGAADAKVLATEFTPVFEEGDLISLERFNMCLKLMVEGMTSAPFSAMTMPITEPRTDNREKVIKLSRSKYSTDLVKVEERIRTWTERQFTLGLAKAEEMRALGPKSEVILEKTGTETLASPVLPVEAKEKVEPTASPPVVKPLIPAVTPLPPPKADSTLPEIVSEPTAVSVGVEKEEPEKEKIIPLEESPTLRSLTLSSEPLPPPLPPSSGPVRLKGEIVVEPEKVK